MRDENEGGVVAATGTAYGGADYADKHDGHEGGQRVVADYDLKREISSVKKTLAVAALQLAATPHAATKQRAQEPPRSRPGQQQEREGYGDRDPQSPVQPRPLAGRLRLTRFR